MPGFSTIVNARARKPAAIILLKPEHFSPAWPDIPKNDVAVGVRLLSENEVQIIKAEASKIARNYYPEADEDDELLNDCFAEELMKLAVARATTNPNDAGEAYFPAPDDMVGEAWPPKTIRRLWDELERCTIERSPIQAEIADEELEELAELLRPALVGKLMASQQVRLRKLLRFTLDELRSMRGVSLMS